MKRTRRSAFLVRDRLGVLTRSQRRRPLIRPLLAFTLVAALVLSAPSASARSTRVKGPFLLVALPALGTLTWRCDPSRHPGLAPGLPGLALVFRAFEASADDSLRLRAGGRIVLSRRIFPGQSVALPYLQSGVQRVDLAQGTEAGTLRASVTVTFVLPSTATYCNSYLPPRIDVHVLPRH
jgi:hypothetical protein